MPDRRIVYLDANVFLYYINDDVDRAPIIDAILSEGEDLGLPLFTSELSIVEVAFGASEQKKKALDSETEERIDKLWLPGSPVRLVEYYRLIGDDARSLIRLAVAKGWALTPIDAIHLATARRMEATEVHTYDDKLYKFSNDIGLEVREPHTTRPKLDL